MTTDEDLVERYLLGSLSDADREIVEGRIFSDENFFDLVEFAEDELIDAYSYRRLSSENAARFEQHFLQSPRRRERLAVATALRDHFDNAPRSSSSLAGFANHVRTALDSLGFVRVLAAAMCALAIFLASLAGVLAVKIQTERSVAATFRRNSEYEVQQLRDRLAQQTANPAATIQNPPVTVAFVLAPGILRGARERILTVSTAASSITLTLQTGFALSAGSYRLALTSQESRPVWETEFIWPAGAPADQPLAVTIPSSHLPPGRYILTLSAQRTGAAEPLQDYAFVVRRR